MKYNKLHTVLFEDGHDGPASALIIPSCDVSSMLPLSRYRVVVEGRSLLVVEIFDVTGCDGRPLYPLYPYPYLRETRGTYPWVSSTRDNP